MENKLNDLEKAIKNIKKDIELAGEGEGFYTEVLCDKEDLEILLNEVAKNFKTIEPINAYKLIETSWAADKLKEMNYDTFMEHLKQSEIEIVTKISEIIDYINKIDEERN